MKIKRTFAPTMREALIIVKQEQGDDAVILGNKKVPGGVEILSAVDFDEVAMNSLQTPKPVQPRITQTDIDPVQETHKQSQDLLKNDDWADRFLTQNQADRREPTLGPVVGSPKSTPANADKKNEKPVQPDKPLEQAASGFERLVKQHAALQNTKRTTGPQNRIKKTKISS